jgi:hypothetical protein
MTQDQRNMWAAACLGGTMFCLVAILFATFGHIIWLGLTAIAANIILLVICIRLCLLNMREQAQTKG